MKLMKCWKKSLKIFVFSFLFCFINNVNAVELDTNYFVQSSFDVEEYIIEVATINNINLDDYYVLVEAVFYKTDPLAGGNHLFAVFVKKEEQITFTYTAGQPIKIVFGNTNTHSYYYTMNYFYKKKIDFSNLKTSTYFHEFNSNYTDVYSGAWTKTFILYSDVDIYKASDNTLYYAADEPIQIIDYELKKEYTHKDYNNNLKYIDLYFDNTDFGKKIDFKLNITEHGTIGDNHVNIAGFYYSYLMTDENGLNYWKNISSTDTKVAIDYSGSEFPKNEDGTGLELVGTINLDFDSSYDFKKIRVSFQIISGFDFSYTYSDTSSITEDDIDNYYYNMLDLNGNRLNRINIGFTKYMILSTKKESINSSLLVEYINTNKYMYVEYFDTDLNKYLSSGNISTSNTFINYNRDFEYYNFTIGTTKKRGLYLMNYLYQKKNENLASSYNIYLTEDIYYSFSDYLDQSLFYDNDTNLDTSIVINPTYESDYTEYTDFLNQMNEFLTSMEDTSDLFNDSWYTIYSGFPFSVKGLIIFFTNMICILILLKIAGYQ